MMTGDERSEEMPAGPRTNAELDGSGEQEIFGAAAPPAPAWGDGQQTQSYSAAIRRRRLRYALTAATAVVVVTAAAVALDAATSGSRPRQVIARLTAQQVVERASQQQQALRTFAATFSESVTGAASASISGSMQMQRKPLLMAMSLTENAAGRTVPLAALVTRDDMYLKLPASFGVPKKIAAKWIKLPLAGLDPSSSLAEIQHELDSENPAVQTAALTAAEHLREVGSQVVDGVPTTEYAGSISPAAAAKQVPADERAQLAPEFRQITGDITCSVWIDGHGYVRKLVETEQVAGSRLTTTFLLDSFNQPVNVTVPPASKIYSIPLSALNG